MRTPQLYSQLREQLGQWIVPKDVRHLKNCAEIVAAILTAESASMAQWIPYLSHRNCQARSHLARLSYYMHNHQINQDFFLLGRSSGFFHIFTLADFPSSCFFHLNPYVLMTLPFKRRFKELAKRYLKIQADIQPIVEALEYDDVIGDRIAGTDFVVFKVRARNSDIPTVKSGGYRLIYQLVSPECIYLLLIYAKSERLAVCDSNREDITVAEIEEEIDKS